MNAQIGKSTGIALLMAAALLAALFAMGVFSPVGVSANTPVFTNFNVDADLDDDATTTANDSYLWEFPENTTDRTFGRVSVAGHSHDDSSYTVTYSLLAADLEDGFSISATTGEIRYNGAGENFEDATVTDHADATDIAGVQHFGLTVTAEVVEPPAHDPGDTETARVFVTITDVNEAPEITSNEYAGEITENNANADTDGVVSINVSPALTATDVDTTDLAAGATPPSPNPDNQAAIVYSISDDGGYDGFEIDADSGALTYNGMGLNFEGFEDDGMCPNPDFVDADNDGVDDNDATITATIDCLDDITLTVSVSDDEGLSGTEMIVINVRNQADTDEPPAKPDAPTVTRKNGETLTARWGQPDNTGPSITSYSVESRTAATDMDAAGEWEPVATVDIGTGMGMVLDNAAGRSVDIEDLMTGTQYEVRVSATNADDTSAWSDQSRAIEPAAKPGAPQNVNLTVGSGQLMVSWMAPANDGGLPITGYEISWVDGGSERSDSVAATLTSHTITGLQDGTSYSVTVVAENEVGSGTPSAPTAETPVGVPSSPLSLALNANQNSVFASWEVPARDGGQSITKYMVQHKIGSADYGTPEETTDTAHEIPVDSSTSSRTITVQVMAVNASGNGSSATRQARIPAAPAAVEGIDNTLTLSKTVGSSDSPGAKIRLTLKAKLGTSLDETIAVKLSKFGLPDDIATSRVTIRSNDGTNRFEGNPTDITVSGSTVNLVLGTLSGVADSSMTMDKLDMNNVTTIIIQQGAGITNPTEAGEYDVEVGDDDATNKATVNRSVSVSPTSGSRGTEITITGKGFSGDDVQVFLDEDGDGNLGSDEPNLGQADIDDGSFELVVTTGDAFDAGANTINASDSAGNEAGTDKDATFTIKSKIEASPTEIALSKKLTINMSDWDAGEVTGVSFGGGAQIKELESSSYDSGDDTGKVEVIVPAGTRLGRINVDLYVGKNMVGTTTVTVVALALTVTPSTAVPGQEITISGGGFSGGKDIASISIGGVDIPSSVADDFSAATNGNVIISLTVPGGVTKAGDATVVVTDTDARQGRGKVTIAGREIELNPATSTRGSTVNITGSGFPAGLLVQVNYGDAAGSPLVGTAQANNQGEFSSTFIVPTTIATGSTTKVTAKGTTSTGKSVTAKADHKTPSAEVTLNPSSVVAGGRLTVTGSNFGGFAQVTELMIGSVSVLTTPAPATDRDGNFTASNLLIPQFDPGTQRVKVTVGQDTITVFLTITTEEEVVSTAPADVFADLGDRLSRVWWLDAQNQDWLFYDPDPELASFNNLTEVTVGEAYIIIISDGDPVEFQDRTLYAGSNNVALR